MAFFRLFIYGLGWLSLIVSHTCSNYVYNDILFIQIWFVCKNMYFNGQLKIQTVNMYYEKVHHKLNCVAFTTKSTMRQRAIYGEHKLAESSPYKVKKQSFYSVYNYIGEIL